MQGLEISFEFTATEAARLFLEISNPDKPLLEAFKDHLKGGLIEAFKRSGIPFDQKVQDSIQVILPDWIEELSRMPLEEIKKISSLSSAKNLEIAKSSLGIMERLDALEVHLDDLEGNLPLMTPSQILDLIDPVDPDSLQPAGGDTWTARWAQPIPEAKVEALRRTPGVDIIREYEPADLPGWLAVEFKIDPVVTRAAPED